MKTKLFYLLLFTLSITFGQIPTNGLVAQYEFTNGSFTDAISSANLTQNSTALTQVADRLSNTTSAISLNGDYLTRSNLTSGNDITYSFWIKTSTDTNDLKTIIDDSQKNGTNNSFSGSQIGYAIMLQNGKIVGHFRMNFEQRFTGANTFVTKTIRSSGFIADGNWHHIVVRFNTSTRSGQYSFLSQLYIDGNLDQTDTSGIVARTFPLFDSSGDVAIANNRNNTINANLRYNDIVDDILVYNRALTAQEIINISNTVRATRTTYVDVSATGNNDGTSWANAYTDLQVALSTSIPGDVIWVAKGTYKPHASNRDASFIFQNNIYGGFAGNETTLADRDMSLIHTTNATILSGDLSSNDDATVDFNDTTRADNSKHVVEINANNLEVNGFTIKDGNADSLNGDDRFGAGIFKEISVPNLTVKNCTIKNNIAFTGAGLSLSSTDQSTIIIDACIIKNNLANAAAGLDFHLSGTNKSMNITISNSLFTGNETLDDTAKSRLGTGAAAARLRAFFGGVTLDATIVNNTFANNNSLGATGTTATGNFPVIAISKTSGAFGNLTIANNIFWGNLRVNSQTAPAIGKATNSNIPFNSVSSSKIVVNNTEENGFSTFTSTPGGTITTNPSLDTNFKLTSGSTAIDSGDNSYVTTSKDLLGNARIFNTTVDRGAYESGNFITRTLTLTATNGTITTNPNPVNGTYDDGTAVTLTATPNTNYGFVNWSGDISGTTNTITVTMDADKTIEANFSTTASIKDANKIDFSVYPNPSKNKIAILIDDEIKSGEIFNVIGRKVKSFTTNNIDISALSTGIYLIKLETESGKIAMKKMIKN